MDTSRRAFLHGRWSEDPDRTPGPAPAAEIVSCIVQTRPEHLAEVALRVAAVQGAEIHARDPKGKLVVVLEAESQRVLGRRMIEIDQLPHVLSVAMVFQATDADALS